VVFWIKYFYRESDFNRNDLMIGLIELQNEQDEIICAIFVSVVHVYNCIAVLSLFPLSNFSQ
jgi:hypothetical protein